MSGKALCSIRAHCCLGLRFVAITTKRFRIHNLFRSETHRLLPHFSSYFRNMPRDPYPFPRLQNDSDFYGQQGKQVKENRTLAKSNSDGTAWDRLNKTATLASSRREIFHHDPQAPHDSLDFVIKSTYDHHKEFLSSKAETLVQHETAGLPHGRILKNRPPPEEPEVDLYKLPLMKSTSTQRQSIHSINGAIESHHSAATNGGYSRKHDGGFYTC